MKARIPLLLIAGVIHIFYQTYFYWKHGRRGDEEGWGQLAVLIMIGAGIIAILIDYGLRRRIKNPTAFYLTEFVLIIAGYLLFYPLFK